MRNVYQNLKDGGIYVFDILNLTAMTDQVVIDFAMHISKKVNDTQIHVIQCSTIDRKAGLLTSYDNYTIQKNADKPQRFNNVFALQLYTAQELQEMLMRNGFEVVALYDMDGTKFYAQISKSILVVARKGSASNNSIDQDNNG